MPGTGLAIAAATADCRLGFSVLAWLEKLRLAAWLPVIAGILIGCYVLVSLLGLGERWGGRAFYLVGLIVAISPLWLAAWLAMSPNPGQIGIERCLSARRIARIALLALVAEN